MSIAPSWLPAIPPRLAKDLARFTPTAKGWVRWYKGRTRYVCSKTTPLGEVEDRWAEVKREIDAEPAPPPPPAAGTITFRHAASKFFEYVDHRVKTGQPEPMAAVTAEDYKRTLITFGRTVDAAGVKFADRQLETFGPPEFQIFAQRFTGRAPSTFARTVAYIRAFFNFCKDERHADRAPNFGRFFRRPSQQQHRDVRLTQRKSFTPAELQSMAELASVEERAWLGLAMSGALDNADIAHLTFDLLDRDAGTIDYRRRKAGKVLRIIPVHPMAWQWLDTYLTVRPSPATPDDEGRVFLTPTGLPVQRIRPGQNGSGHGVDYVAMTWGRLMVRAGLRSPPTVTTLCGACRRPLRTVDRGDASCCAECGEVRPNRVRRMAWPKGESDRRGFRSLRTTFPNLAPRGFRDEIELVMGHTGGRVLLSNYLEEHGVEPLKELVERVWVRAFTCPLISV